MSEDEDNRMPLIAPRRVWRDPTVTEEVRAHRRAMMAAMGEHGRHELDRLLGRPVGPGKGWRH